MGDLWIWKYQLRAAGALNSRTKRQVYEGALVRKGAGFGCVHPWPELGDLCLDDCLADLAGRGESRLVKRTLSCLREDAMARESGRSLFAGMAVPKSHATLRELSEASLDEAVERGFGCVKIKSGLESVTDLQKVRNFQKQWPQLRWRIDFNESGEACELLKEFAGWSGEEKEAIDFLEDPVTYHGGDWQKLGRESGVALANDRHADEDGGDSEFLVIKPAVNEVPQRTKVVVTSYMDHSFGQAFAAWEAGRAGVDEICGLQTHGLFERDGFGEMLGEVAPGFTVPEGTGLGFDDLLAKLPWVKLGA